VVYKPKIYVTYGRDEEHGEVFSSNVAKRFDILNKIKSISVMRYNDPKLISSKYDICLDLHDNSSMLPQFDPLQSFKNLSYYIVIIHDMRHPFLGSFEKFKKNWNMIHKNNGSCEIYKPKDSIENEVVTIEFNMFEEKKPSLDDCVEFLIKVTENLSQQVKPHKIVR
jgi:hypothetical protein